MMCVVYYRDVLLMLLLLLLAALDLDDMFVAVLVDFVEAAFHKCSDIYLMLFTFFLGKCANV